MLKMTKRKRLCSNCIHKNVCGRLQYASEYKKEHDNAFKANSIADICQEFLMIEKGR